MGFPGDTVVKNPPIHVGEFNPWVRKIPWRRKWQPIPVFLPGKSHGQRSLAASMRSLRIGLNSATKQQKYKTINLSKHMIQNMDLLPRALVKHWVTYSNKSVLSLSSGRKGLKFSSVQLHSCIWLFVTPWTAARQASLSITNSQSLLKLMSIESVMP